MVKVLAVTTGPITEVDVVATSSPIAWTTLPLATGWSVVANFATPAYRLVSGNRVVVKGCISRSGLLSAGDTIATFPAGFRPKEQRAFVGAVLGGTIGLVVKPTGELVYGGLTALTGVTQLSLDALEFDTEQ